MKTKKSSYKNKSDSTEDPFAKLMEDHHVIPLDDEQEQCKNKLSKKDHHLYIGDEYFCNSPDIEYSNKYSGLEADDSKPRRIKRVVVNRHFQADFVLDLHGETRDSAMGKARYAFHIAEKKHYQTLLIITGKGINSENAVGVLKTVIWDWLSYEKKEGTIESFKSAPNFLGGSGAILVFFY